MVQVASPLLRPEQVLPVTPVRRPLVPPPQTPPMDSDDSDDTLQITIVGSAESVSGRSQVSSERETRERERPEKERERETRER